MPFCLPAQERKWNLKAPNFGLQPIFETPVERLKTYDFPFFLCKMCCAKHPMRASKVPCESRLEAMRGHSETLGFRCLHSVDSHQFCAPPGTIPVPVQGSCACRCCRWEVQYEQDSCAGARLHSSLLQDLVTKVTC